MDKDDKKEDILDKRMVETLFGPVEESDTPDYQEIIQEEMPHYLFGGQYDRQQVDLPLVQVPHYRPKIIAQDNIPYLIPFLDELALFEKRWGFEKKSGDREGWCHWVKAQAVPVLEKLTELCGSCQLLQPRALYSYFFCAARDNTLCLYKKDRKEIFLEIELPRLKNGVCLTDKVAAAGSGSFDTIAAVAVNMGRNVTEIAKSWRNAGKNVDYGYLQGFALEMLNAMTQYTASVIATEGCCLGDVFSLGSAKEGEAKVQAALIEMLDASLIDIAFNKNYLMMPEYSSLALVFPR
ncbi:MAG: hypothetical protein J5787_06410 [Alphaproteobacteria bacterium]|nr:hypothetical protein [Alphaproteobacteria bacterium]MBO4644469.1 hypothetical protein [Alphaproteobacteria bacterium]